MKKTKDSVFAVIIISLLLINITLLSYRIYELHDLRKQITLVELMCLNVPLQQIPTQIPQQLWAIYEN